MGKIVQIKRQKELNKLYKNMNFMMNSLQNEKE